MFNGSRFPRICADEAADMIFDGATVGYSGFTPAGAAKATPRALAARMREMKLRNQQIVVRVLSAAGNVIDDDHTDSGVSEWRPLRDGTSRRTAGHGQRFPALDMQSSYLPQMIECGLFGDLDFAVVEAVDVMPDGRVYLSTSGGPSPTFLRHAAKVVIEINHRQSSRLTEFHDVALPQLPYRSHIPIAGPLDLIGAPYVTIDPNKVVGIVETDESDAGPSYGAPDKISDRIADHLVRFVRSEMKAGRIPPEFLPVQVGAGNVANAILARMGASDLPLSHAYGDVIPDALIDLIESGHVRPGASGTSLTLSPSRLCRVFDNMDFFASRVVLRPQQISNDSTVLQRLGIVALNSVLEVDVFGCARVNADGGARSVACGGSRDFVRNAYLSCLVMPSLSPNGEASAIVPRLSHVDYDARDVQILVTEHGLADLRGLDVFERAHAIISQCAHPQHRDALYENMQSASLSRIIKNPPSALDGAAQNPRALHAWA